MTIIFEDYNSKTLLYIIHLVIYLVIAHNRPFDSSHSPRSWTLLRMEPFGFESGPSRAMSAFKSHEENYHRCSQAINRHINGLQLGRVEAAAAENLPNDLAEAEQYVSFCVVLTDHAHNALSLPHSEEGNQLRGLTRHGGDTRAHKMLL